MVLLVTRAAAVCGSPQALFELRHGDVEGSVGVLGRRLRADHGPPGPEGELDPVARTGQPRIAFVTDLDIYSVRLGVQALEPVQLLPHVFTEALADLGTSTLHHDVEPLDLIDAVGTVHTSSSRPTGNTRRRVTPDEHVTLVRVDVG